MNHVILEDKDRQSIYSMYLSGAYKNYFRHLPEGLDSVKFNTFNNMVWGLEKIVDDSGELVAYIGVRGEPLPKLACLNILIPKRLQHKGNAFKSVSYVLEMLFTNGFNRAVAVISESDDRAKELLLKAGFEAEGRYIDSYFMDDNYGTELRLGMSKETYIERYKRN